jgi:hypothetical protein
MIVSDGKMPDGPGLSRQVHAIFCEHFAWGARCELGAPVTLGWLDEDTALDALAEFLWEQRLCKREASSRENEDHEEAA